MNFFDFASINPEKHRSIRRHLLWDVDPGHFDYQQRSATLYGIWRRRTSGTRSERKGVLIGLEDDLKHRRVLSVATNIEYYQKGKVF